MCHSHAIGGAFQRTCTLPAKFDDPQGRALVQELRAAATGWRLPTNSACQLIQRRERGARHQRVFRAGDSGRANKPPADGRHGRFHRVETRKSILPPQVGFEFRA